MTSGQILRPPPGRDDGVDGSLLLGVRGGRDPAATLASAWRLYRAPGMTTETVFFVIVLAAMIGRIGELGFTPNRTAALGLNLLLLVSLAGTAWLSTGFLTGQDNFHRLERWQTSYLPIFALWAAAVVVTLPPLFDFT